MGPDTVRLAQLKGLILSEASAMYDWHNDFSAAANRLEASYPELFADARIDDDSRGAEITFIGTVPAEAEALVKTVPVPVRLGLSTGVIPLAQLKAELKRAYREIYADPEVADATGSLDVSRTSITFIVQPEAHLTPPAQEQLLRRLKQMAPSTPGISTSISLSNQAGGRLGGR